MGRKRVPEGWMEGSAEVFLGLSDEEAAIVEMRLRLADDVRARRQRAGLTQRALARRMGSTQPRVARMEQGGGSVELLMRALLALGADRVAIGRMLSARRSRRGSARHSIG
jgi:hypothetical protein